MWLSPKETYGVGGHVDGGDGAVSWAVGHCGGTVGDGVSDGISDG